jgi:5-hydroxyisourate hydrolase
MSDTPKGHPTITTHVLDTSIGRPAAGVRVFLEERSSQGWILRGRDTTDVDGRARPLSTEDAFGPGMYRLKFDSGAYFQGRGLETFFPQVEVTFTVPDAAKHHHVPLLLSPFGYSTYRGS